MSIESLLNSLMVPCIPSDDSEGEQLKALEGLNSSTSSLSSHDLACTHNEDIKAVQDNLLMQPGDLYDPLISVDANSVEVIKAYNIALEIQQDIKNGKRPSRYTEIAMCKHCGPIWLWTQGEVIGCPWCMNRAADLPIPRPYRVQCADCNNFESTNHAQLGHCMKGQLEAPAGLWDDDYRYCEKYAPLGDV